MRYLSALFFLMSLLLPGCGSITAPATTGSDSSTTVPQNLKVLQSTSTSVILSWTASSGDVFAYKIFRNGQEIGSTSRQGTTPAATVYTDNSLTPATTYVYAVVAVSSGGAVTDKSQTASTTTLSADASSIPPPTALTVTQTTSSSVTITWTAASGIEGTTVSYRVYRNTLYVGTVTVPVATTASYTDTNLSPSTTYYYSVSVEAESVQSTPITVTTQGLSAAAQSAVTTIAGTGGGKGGSADAVGSLAGFSLPGAVATDGTSLFVADTGNNTIRRIDLSSRSVTTFAGAAGVSGSADGIGSDARFNSPRGITCDGGYLYVTDSGNNTVRRISLSTAEVTTIAGSAGARGSSDGVGTAARFYTPRGIATDGINLYVADTSNNTIRKIAIGSRQVTTLAGYPQVRGSNDGFGTAASFYVPYGLATDGTNVYVSDTANNLIRKVVIATGEVSTLAGSPVVHGTADGTGTSASFYYPDGIVTDGTSLYVCDTSNHTVRKVVIATGQVVTVAGYPGLHGTSDGSGTVARFYNPRGITLLGSDLYVADSSNNTIRKISLSLLQ